MSVRTTILLWLLPVAAVFSVQCNADQALSLDAAPNQPVNWRSGPANASLGTLADIKIAKGYQFTDATGASELLQRMHNPIPKGLVGILAPASGQWWAVLTYKDIGHVRVSDKNQINAAEMLKTISSRVQFQNEDRAIHGLPSITSVNWKLPPVYDAKTHALEWAVEAKTQTGDVINHTMGLLGREGVLDATVVEPYQSGGADTVPLKELMKNISFKPGQRYADFQKGDTVADIGLVGLIAGTDDSTVAQKNTVATPAKSAGGWSWYAYVGLGVLAGGGVLLLRRTVRRRHRRTGRALSVSPVGNGNETGKEFARRQPANAIVSASLVSGNGHESVGWKPAGVGLSGTEPKEEISKKEIAVGNGSDHRPGARRKKVKAFDYHRFYTDTVMKLSSGAYTEISTANGNGRINGRSRGQSIPSQPPTQGDANQALVQAHLDLITNQKELIEEQKRLMIQQAKLIEEKSKLIAEKSQLLDRQTELFERDVL